MRIIKATVEKIEDFRKDDMKDALRLMGFDYLEMNFYRRVDIDGDLVMYGELYDDAVLITVYENSQEVESTQFTSPIRFIDFVESILNHYDIPIAENIDVDELVLADNGIVTATTNIFAKGFNRHDGKQRQKYTTKDLGDKMKRVDSSNVWSYAFQPKDNKFGDLLMQFKDRDGGPGDIYIYYNVLNKVWQKFSITPSKGRFFWRNIRNNMNIRYAKLTGDRRTHLPNGI